MAAQQLRSRSALASVLCPAAAALLLTAGPSFLGTPAAPRVASARLLGAATPAAALLTEPMAAHAADGLPTPILGIGMLSVIVVLVLLISGVAIGRGPVETIDDL